MPFDVERRVNLRSFSPSWPVLILLFALLLSACERPLREAPGDATLTPDLGLTVIPDSTPAVPAVGETPGATPGTGEQTDTGATPITGETPVTPTDTPVPATPGETEEVIYRVVSGDTLGKIAERYGISVDALAAANNIANPNVLDVGQELVIPVAGNGEVPPATGDPDGGDTPRAEEQVHIVQRGENLYRIGLQYGIGWEALAAYNNIGPPYRLEVGQPIRIPPSGYQP